MSFLLLVILPTSNTHVCLLHFKGTNLNRYGGTTTVLGPNYLPTPPDVI